MNLIVVATTLMDCVRRGDRDSVAVLLASGADPDTVDLLDGLPALHHAIQHGHADIAQLLLQHGARPIALPPSAPASLPEPIQAVAFPSSESSQPEPLAGWSSALMRDYFLHGFIRRPHSPESDNDEDWEVRFLSRSKRTIELIGLLLAEGGFRCAEPFRKYGYHMLSVPGREAVERIAALWQANRKRFAGG